MYNKICLECTGNFTGVVISLFMRKFLLIIYFSLMVCNIAYSDSDLKSKKINLTCSSIDKTINYNVMIVIIGEGENGLGSVNNKIAEVLISDANYKLDYSIADGGIKIFLTIDRTTGEYREVWTSENTDPKVFIGKCKKVDPKF